MENKSRPLLSHRILRTVGTLALGLSLGSCGIPGVVEFGGGAMQGNQTPEAAFLPTPFPTATVTEGCGLFDYFAADIVSSNPKLSKAEVTRQLELIADKIPPSLPSTADACMGLIPNPATGEVIAIPGPISWNSPEGGFGYLSTGHVTIAFKDKPGHRYNLPYKENNVHLVFVMGRPDDFSPADMNRTFKATDYPAGHMYANLADPRQDQEFSQRRVIDKAWFAQQLWWAGLSGSNCGVGCEYTITVTFIDAQTEQERIYQVDPKTFNWKEISPDQLKSQTIQKKQDRVAAGLTGRNPNRITKPLHPKHDRNPFAGIRNTPTRT